MLELRPLGDRAVRALFATEAEASAWTRAVARAALVGVVDVVLAYRAATVVADPDQVADWDAWVARLKGLAVADDRAPIGPGRLVRVPVWYAGEDLAEVARAVGWAEARVIACHSGVDYPVFAVGFQPGFPYAGYLAAALSGLARRTSPRPRVPSGSVAIAGRQTGIYPSASPGGWHLLGRTPLRVVDLDAAIFPIEPGDTLRFEPIPRAEFDRLQALDPPPLLRAEAFAGRD